MRFFYIVMALVMLAMAFPAMYAGMGLAALTGFVWFTPLMPFLCIVLAFGCIYQSDRC